MRKTYIVTLDKEFDFALAPKMKKGVSIEEGFARMDDIYRVGPRTLKVVLTQGLKRQIREMFYKFGYEVKRLVRIQIGNLHLENLPAGQHKVLTQDDVKRYFPSGPAVRPAKKTFPTKEGSRRPLGDGRQGVAVKDTTARHTRVAKTATKKVPRHE